tara:strand:- start:303 stop:1208 length:906 start_codon:yes stop_codon:yes gene_type:complete
MSGIVRANNSGQSGAVSNIETIDSDDYVDASIDNAHLADDAVDSDELAAGSVDTAHLAADVITGAKIADDAIDSEHYTDGSIDNAHIADDAIDSEHYAAGSIDTAHIADNQVTLAKMAGITRGSIIYGDASGDPAALAKGTDTYVLTAGADDISWAAAAGGPRSVIKTADETLNNNNTLQNDDHLVLSIDASSRYSIELWLNVNPNATSSDFACNIALPSGATMVWDTIYHFQSSRGSKDGNQGAKLTVLALSTGSHFVPLNGHILVDTTAGNAQLQWAQDTAVAENTTVLAGSWMRLTKM